MIRWVMMSREAGLTIFPALDPFSFVFVSCHTSGHQEARSRCQQACQRVSGPETAQRRLTIPFD